MKKKILKIMVFLIIIGILYTNYNYKKYKAGEESFFDKIPNLDPYKVEQAKNQMHDDYQELKIDDYTFVLDKVVYSREDSMGWCRFKVTRDGKNMENESGVKVDQSYGSMFGEDKQFKFWPADEFLDTCTVGLESWYSVKGDVMYIYQYINVDDCEVFNHCVYLHDARTARMPGDQSVEDMSGIFELREDTELNEYENQTADGTYKVTVSPYILNINGNKELKSNDIKIHLKNKETLTLKENGTVSEGIEVYGEYIPGEHIKTYSYVLGFSENIDVNQVDYVEINGDKLTIK